MNFAVFECTECLYLQQIVYYDHLYFSLNFTNPTHKIRTLSVIHINQQSYRTPIVNLPNLKTIKQRT